MGNTFIHKSILAVATLALTLTAASAADFGVDVQESLHDRSTQLFGIAAPLTASATPTDGPYRMPNQDAADQIALAGGLHVEYLTRNAGHHLDMYDFYPAENPTHLIACIESSLEEIAAGKLNPSVQSISLSDGSVKTLLRGMNRCDGIRTTAWGTVLATEETGDGAAYELMSPLTLDNAAITDRATGETTNPELIAKRTALPTMAWEGLTITQQGVVIGGDELRPGTDTPDADGGAIFKFIPAHLHTSPLP